ncbi:hypothetical protein [Streptomyces sp. SID8352]|uniref:hypothetical protein n=1 Tax=Streptomyces sp. SID8352 TaxID=2690338 RepID=UPI001369E4BD|nr:hypothetical protein [Streptomyces sp. SID8352]MYU21205.1 hypothetical protein [Streptomyces sp. SID8352]
MTAEISLPVYVRVGGVEARWGELTFDADGSEIRERDTRRALATFLRAAADHLENAPEDDEEVPDAAAHG